MTARQRVVLLFIEGYVARTGGVCPSYAEIDEACGLKSVGGAHATVGQLVERGYLRRMPKIARSIEVIRRAPATVAPIRPPRKRCSPIAFMGKIS